MSSFFIEEDFGHYEITANRMSREDVFELVRLLEAAESPYLARFRLEIESELMQVTN